MKLAVTSKAKYYKKMLLKTADGWMSWKRKGSKPLEVVFKFEAPRNFSKVNIFTSNLFHLNVQVSCDVMRQQETF